MNSGAKTQWKKGSTQWTIVSLILVLAVGAFLLMSFSYIKKGAGTITDSKKFIQANFRVTPYFYPETVLVSPIAGCLPPSTIGAAMQCTTANQGVQPKVKISIGVKNTGSSGITVLANPKISSECNDQAVCKEEKYLEGAERCFLPITEDIQECVAGEYVLKKGTYRIYPGALIKAQEYTEITKEATPNDVATLNSKNVYVIEVR